MGGKVTFKVSNAPHVTKMKNKFPAWYYDIEVFVGSSDSFHVLRRYSEFLWLNDELRSSPPPGAKIENLVEPPPSGSCFCQRNTETFRNTRKAELFSFLEGALLQQKGFSQHPAMKEFLAFDK